MASLRQKPRSPYWFACYTLPDGRRTQVSTKQVERKAAQKFADKLEEAAKLAASKRLGEAQARKLIADIYEGLHGQRLVSMTAREFFIKWGETREVDTAPKTAAAYQQVVRDFLESLGPRAEFDMSQVGKKEIADFRDIVLRRTSISNANKATKILKVAFGSAYRDGYISENPADKLISLRMTQTERRKRRPFTPDELRKILTVAEGEWRGMLLFGIYTGQRLRDIARLTWNNVDLSRGSLSLITSKTGRRVELSIAPPLLSYVEKLPSSDNPSTPLFPKSAALANRKLSDARLSQQFHSILVAAGLAEAQSKETQDGTGDGRARKRKVSEISFHSLRHTLTSILKNAGVSNAIAMDIIGHESEAISQHYTHVDLAAKEKALSQVPDFTK